VSGDGGQRRKTGAKCVSRDWEQYVSLMNDGETLTVGAPVVKRDRHFLVSPLLPRLTN
jgi:hypothetical protein